MAAKLVKERQHCEDTYQWVPETHEGDYPEGDLLVPLSLWQADRERLKARDGTRLGVCLEPHEEPESLADELAHFDLIAIHFPKFTDGRGYSSARLLRERFQFSGEIRACGDVLRDQLLYMARCGFDAFALREDQDPAQAVQALDDFSVAYQSAVDQPLPIFRRRHSSC